MQINVTYTTGTGLVECTNHFTFCPRVRVIRGRVTRFSESASSESFSLLDNLNAQLPRQLPLVTYKF